MTKNYSVKLKCATISSLLVSSMVVSQPALAEVDWYSFTMDNDIFVGVDAGYTNGFYFSWYDTPLNNKPEPGYLARSMLWSLPENAGEPMLEINASSVGQTMMTPSDIEIADPPQGDLPYTGLLFYNSTFIRAFPNYADKISVSVGVIGPLSLAEDAQNFVHEITGSEEALGWDTQLDNEIVFRFGRARAWRSWVADSASSDIITGVDAALGTIQSTAGAAIMYRYGGDLQRTYATALLGAERTANPVAIEGAWYLYAGARVGYLANWIFLDGNTYEDSREIKDYKNEMVSISVGLAYSWDNFSLTYSFNDLNVLADDDEKELEELTQYGTFTLAWRAD